MNDMERRVRTLRAAAKAAGYRLHYDGDSYSLLGPENSYGLTLDEAENKITR